MIIYNMNLKNTFKAIFIILILVILVILGIGIYRIFFYNKNIVNDNDITGKVNIISSQNYTNILQEVHSNLNTYAGEKIRFTGFVYRLYDFNEDQFVLAREMIVSSNYQAVIVGFLCHLNGASKYKDGTWVEVEGTINKGDYHGEIPVIEIYKINESKVPNDEYVYPPKNTYLKTENQL